MEENVALDTSKQKQFVKSIKGIKKLIKKADREVPEKLVPKAQDEKKPKRKRPERGLVYLSHIPHGFYEHEMTQYFKQFGAVSNVRVIRSKRTGNSKGFAFIEFKQPAVAEIVAETMNNYLMGKRLLKAAFVPPEKQRPKAMRKHWTRLNNPGKAERLKQKKAYNENRDKAGELARARKTLATYKKNMKKLRDLEINYDFFTPVDIPEELEDNQNSQMDKNKNALKKDIVVQNKDSKAQKKDKIKETKQTVPAKKEDTVVQDKVGKAQKKHKIKETKQTVPAKEAIKEKSVNSKKSKVPEPIVNKREQKQKQQKLKEAGVKPPENFIQIEQEADDSDSSADFDSDDYIKLLANESDVESDDESGGDGESDEFEITGSDDDDSEVDEREDEEVIPSAKKGKGKLGPIVPPMQPKKKVKPQAKQLSKAPQQTRSKSSGKESKGPVLQTVLNAPQQGKRKALQNDVGNLKKPKFEKQTQQSMKKQFKKKK